MAGLMETLFGADGIGGQPGLVGKAGNAVWNGTGELPKGAGLGQTVANSLGNIPHFLTDIAVKNPLEILKNPMSALNDKGEVSITRLLFPDYRRKAVKQGKEAEELRKAQITQQVMNTYDKGKELISSFGAGERKPIVDQLEQSGVDPEALNAMLGAAGRQDAAQAAAAQMAQEQGVTPELAQGLTPAQNVSLATGIKRQTLAERNSEIREQRAAEAASYRVAREKRLLTRPGPVSPEEEALQSQAGLVSKQAFKDAQKTSAVPPIIPDTGDEVLNGVLARQAAERASVAPGLAAASARKKFLARARKTVDAIPADNRKAVVFKKAANEALLQAEQMPQNVGLDSPVLQDVPLPTDPAERMQAAHDLGTTLLKAGFPPEKAAAELLRRGFTAEELPE